MQQQVDPESKPETGTDFCLANISFTVEPICEPGEAEFYKQRLKIEMQSPARPSKRANIMIEGLEEDSLVQNFPILLASCSTTHDEASPAIIEPNDFEKFLSQIVRDGAQITSPWGADSQEIAQKYRESLEPFPKVTYLNLLPEGHESERTWIHVDHHSAAVLERSQKILKISDGAVAQLQTLDQIPSAYPSRQNMVVALEEFTIDPQDSDRLLLKDIIAIVGKDALVTLTDGKSEAISRVWAEMRREKDHPCNDHMFMNHLLTRLIGCVLHINKREVGKIAQSCQKFIERTRCQVPSTQDHQQLNKIKTGIERAVRSLRWTEDVLHRLRESDALFGADKPRESLERYDSLRRIILGSLEETAEQLRDLSSSWSTNQSIKLARVQNMIARAAGWITVLTAGSTLIDFGVSQPYAMVGMAALFAILEGGLQLWGKGGSGEKKQHPQL